MREIKFRVWNTETNKMIINVKEMGVFALKSIHTIDEFLVIPTNEKYPLMQYTGLKDKNGIEIYEGDILKLEESNESYETKYLGNRFVLCKYDNIVFENEAYFRERQVVGNIYENQELLKES